MFVLVLALAAATANLGQIIEGPAFERFASETDRLCPSRELRMVTPGDLSWQQETFEEHLSRAERTRWAQAEKQEQHCVGPGGLACPTGRTLDALWRTGMLSAFSKSACDHFAPTSDNQKRISTSSTASASTVILQHLDLNSFPNSTAPRRRHSLHTPADYGFIKLESFDDGWAQISAPEDEWHMSMFLLSGGTGVATVCFLDSGGKGATYRATQVLHVTLGGAGQWSAIQVPDETGCRNSPPFIAKAKPD